MTGQETREVSAEQSMLDAWEKVSILEKRIQDALDELKPGERPSPIDMIYRAKRALRGLPNE